jgi:hypothetical protein
MTSGTFWSIIIDTHNYYAPQKKKKKIYLTGIKKLKLSEKCNNWVLVILGVEFCGGKAHCHRESRSTMQVWN